MTFQEWWATQRTQDDIDREVEDSTGPARAAWDAAIEEAVRRVAETSKRYTCSKMLGVCNAIIYQLQRKD